MRYTNDTERKRFQDAYSKSSTPHLMVSMYAGSVFHHDGHDRGLPTLALERVTGLNDDVLDMLDIIIMRSLIISSKASPLEIA